MKKSILLFTCMLFCFCFSKAQEIATFEEPDLDIFNQPNQFVEIVENPQKSGINTTDHCLMFFTPGNNNWSEDVGALLYDAGLGERIVISESNRYLHVMVYCEVSDGGRIHFCVNPEEDAWNGGNQQENHFNFTAGKWVDIVFDLKDYTQIYGLFFLSQHWNPIGEDRYFYYDEIIVNDDPTPRMLDFVDTAIDIADFEEGGLTPEFIIEGTDGSSTATIVDNLDKWGLNESSKALLFKLEGETTNWTRVKLTFEETIKITDENCYMHVMVKSTANKVSAVFFDYGEDWMDQEGITTGEWTDLVVDLSKYKDQFLTTVAFSSWDIKTAEIYIDEIIFNNDASPRVELPYVDKAAIVANFDPYGITPNYYVEETDGSSTLTVVANPDTEGINTTTNSLYFNQVDEGNSSARACLEFNKPVQVNNSNRYMHVLMRMDISQIDIAIMQEGTDGYQWPYNSRHVNSAVNEWIDVVRDVSEFDVITGIAFSEWGIGNSNVYIDEIIFNDDPTPRGASFVETAVTIADFEADGIIPTFIVEHSDGSSVAEIVDNPDKEGINETATSLLFTQTNEGTDWTWLKLTLDEAVKITDENCYMHVMVRTDAPKISMIFYDYGNEDWIDHEDLTNGEWVDLVTDLSEYKGKVLTRLGFCSYGVGTSEIYIDEVIFSKSSKPRVKLVYIDEATTVADFEPEGITPDYFIQGGDNSTVMLVENPDQSGINETSTSLYFKQVDETENWTRACIEFDNPIIVNNNTRYMHVMIRMDISQIDIGFMEEGADDYQWLHGRYKSKTPNQWVDVVRDVSAFDIVTGVAFSEWGIGTSNVYIDEIIFNDDPDPRGAEVITTAVTIADFDTIYPEWYVEGSDGSSIAMIVANPDKEGLNDTDYALHFIQEGETTAWTRVMMIFDDLVKITDENCYMHAMVKSSASAISTIYFEPEETWLDHENLTTGEWIDIVTDLTAFKGTNLTSVGFCSYGIVNSEIYIDEVMFNNDSKPREREITSIGEIKYVTYYVSGETVYLQTAIDETVEVYDIAGKLCKKVLSTGNISISLDKGIYIIKVGNESIKVVL